jgi:SAM-dependent methyltransferase
MEVKDHYERHLAHFYSWMFGDFESKINENIAFFDLHQINPEGNTVCLDLGAGSGFQSLALAKKGFDVVAVDFSEVLLEELNARKGFLKVKTLQADILDFKAYSNYRPNLVVCMGDTLTHLPGKESIKRLIKTISAILQPEGKFVISFRDLSFELRGENRFIPVKSDHKRILTCFLEYFADHVEVYDLLNEYNMEAGTWDQKVSSYKKLRISKPEIEEMLLDEGLSIEFANVERGFVTLICKSEPKE